MHAHECNELIGEDVVPLLVKTGGAGFQATAHTQNWSEVETRICSRAKTRQAAGNFGTTTMPRKAELATAECPSTSCRASRCSRS